MKNKMIFLIILLVIIDYIPFFYELKNYSLNLMLIALFFVLFLTLIINIKKLLNIIKRIKFFNVITFNIFLLIIFGVIHQLLYNVYFIIFIINLCLIFFINEIFNKKNA